MIRVLVTGSRGWSDEKTISDALREYVGGYDVVVHVATHESYPDEPEYFCCDAHAKNRTCRAIES